MATTRPFAYNTGSPIAGTEQLGDLAIGIPTSGFIETGLEWWNGADEDLGYVICRPVPSDTQPTPIRNSWNPSSVGTGNSLSNNNFTVTNTGVLSSVISDRLVNGSKAMFTIKIEQSVTSGYIGFGRDSMNINSYVGSNDGNSIGFGSDGNFYYYGGVQASNLPTWGNSGDIVDVCIDLVYNKIYIRVNGANWNGILNEDPTSGSGSIGTAGLNNLYPALALFYGSATLLDKKTEIGGYYSLKVGSFTSILGNSTLEDNLISYAKCQGFNIIQLYDLYTVLNSTQLSNQLDSFLTKVYTNGLLPVAIMGSGRQGFDLVNSFEQTPGRVNQFWGVNKENEFWWYPQPETETFTDWIDSMNYVRTTYPHWHRSAYIANPTNSWGSSEAQDMIDAQIDVLEVTNYNSNKPDPNWSAFKNNQLVYLANAANTSGVIQKIAPLWSSESSFSGPYFSTYELPASVSAYNFDYDGISFTNKSKLNKVGFSIFMYSDLSFYVPSCPTLNIIPNGYTFLGQVLASVSFLRSSSLTDQSFVDLVNSKFGQNFPTAQVAKDWLTANGMWTSYGLIPTGMVLYLDASNATSYSGTGNTWYDLSGNGNNVTMQNSGSITWNNTGPIYFSTGVDGWFSNPSGNNMPIGDSQYTFIIWVQLDTNWSANGFMSIGTFYIGNESNAFRTGTTNQLINYWWGNDLSVNSSLSPTNAWFNAVAKYDGTTRSIWVNGSIVSSDVPGTGHNVTSSAIQIAKTLGSEYLYGNVAEVLIYNTSLSNSEIVQYYNATKSRFGY